MEKEDRFMNLLNSCPIMEEYFYMEYGVVDVKRLKKDFKFKSPGEQIMLAFLKVIWDPDGSWFKAIDNFPILQQLRRLDQENEKLIANWVARPFYM